MRLPRGAVVTALFAFFFLSFPAVVSRVRAARSTVHLRCCPPAPTSTFKHPTASPPSTSPLSQVCFVWQHLLRRGVSLHAVFTSPMRLSHRLPFQYNPHPRVRRHRACSCACRCRPQHHGGSLRPHSTSSRVGCGPPLRLQVSPLPLQSGLRLCLRAIAAFLRRLVFQYVTEMQSSFSRSV